MPCILSAAESAIVLYRKIMIKMCSRPALRNCPRIRRPGKRARRCCWQVLDGCNSWLQCSALLNKSSWPLQHCLMKALSVNHTLMSEHHFVLFHHSNWQLCPVRFGQHIQRLSSSILRVGCENEKKKKNTLAVQWLK
jgi:hypothetical protein